jgi:cold shock CspA family protein
MNIRGKIKFVHPKGYGFATTEQGDVFFHLSGFRRPEMQYSHALRQPSVMFFNETIEPNSSMVDHRVDLNVTEGNKGLAATEWWYSDDLEFAAAKMAAMPYYRLVSRRVVVSPPFAVPEERTWKSRHTIGEFVEREGYLPELKSFLKIAGTQVRIEQMTPFGWEPVECPLGYFNGGDLFDRPLDWSEVV